MPRRRSGLWMALVALPAAATADESRFLWLTNSNEGTVSKIDAATGAEVARYATVTHAAVVDVMGVGAGALLPWGSVHQPVSAALDFHGDAWVVNLALNEQPSATRIMNHEPNCFDRDTSGTIETSREVNGTPGIQLADPAEFLAEQDECLAFTVLVGIDGGHPRAVAIDAGDAPADPGDVWVGVLEEQAFYQLDGETGALVRRVPPAGPSGSRPHAAAIDGDGELWAPDGCCGANRRLWRIDTATGAHAATPFAPVYTCNGMFGVAIDLAGRVWVSGWACGSALRFDPPGSTWAEAQIPGYYTTWGALGIAADRLGNLWVTMREHASAASAVARIDATTMVSTGVFDNGGAYTTGIALDFGGDVWSANWGSDDATRMHIDPVTQQPAPHPGTGNVVDVFPVGDEPETFGDLSGHALHLITRPDPPGHIFADGFYSGSTVAWSTAVP